MTICFEQRETLAAHHNVTLDKLSSVQTVGTYGAYTVNGEWFTCQTFKNGRIKTKTIKRADA